MNSRPITVVVNAIIKLYWLQRSRAERPYARAAYVRRNAIGVRNETRKTRRPMRTCVQTFSATFRETRADGRERLLRVRLRPRSLLAARLEKKCKIRPDPITPVRSYPVRRVVRRPVGANPSVVTKPIENVTVALDPMSHVWRGIAVQTREKKNIFISDHVKNND